MRDNENSRSAENAPTRRQVISGAAIAIGSLAAGANLWASPQQAMKEVPGTDANKTRTSLHQEIDLKASAQRIYDVLLDGKQFSAFSGMPAEIDRGGRQCGTAPIFAISVGILFQ
jgi:hypothetical protein